MILKDRAVVIKNGQVGAGLGVEVVGSAGVFVVVNGGGKEHREHFNLAQPVEQTGLTDEKMGCLSNVCSMVRVVVWIAIPSVPLVHFVCE